MHVNDSSDVDALTAKLAKLRSDDALFGLEKIAGMPDLVALLGRDDDRSAFEFLNAELLRRAASADLKKRTVALSLVFPVGPVTARLNAVADVVGVTDVTVRNWGNRGGFREIAAELLRLSREWWTTAARQTTSITYPTSDGAIKVTFIVEVPSSVTDLKSPRIVVNHQDYLDAADHYVSDAQPEVTEHFWGFEIAGFPHIESDEADLPVIKIEFMLDLPIRMMHRFVVDFRSTDHYVGCQSANTFQYVVVVRR